MQKKADGLSLGDLIREQGFRDRFLSFFLNFT